MSKKLKRSSFFAKDVSSLLYAYGDVAQPLPETVQCLDELVSGYLVDVCSSAFRAAQTCQRNKLKLEDFRFAIRNDPIKLGRAEELIATNKLITEAKKQFNGSDNNSLKRFRDEEGNALEGEDEEEEDYEEEADVDDGVSNTNNTTRSADHETRYMDSESYKSKEQYEDASVEDQELQRTKGDKKSKSSTRGGKQGRGGGKTRGKRQKRTSRQVKKEQ